MNKQKLIGTIVGIVLFIAAVAGLTYAALSWTSGDMNKVVSSKCFNVLYDKGTDFSGNITPSTDYTGGISVTVKMDIDSACNINAKGKIYLTTDTTTSSNLYTEGLLNYQVLINGSVTNLKGSITSSGDTVIDVGFLNKNTVATTTYTVYVWINGEYVTNEHATSTFSGSVRSEAVQTTEKAPIKLIDHITSLYINGEPTAESYYDSRIYYYSFQDTDKTWGLMNDGFKVDNSLDATTTGLATTVTDTTALTSGTEGNIRYFGPNASVNNYIYFNCQIYPDTNCEKWRIIGIVDGKVKIIREESIGNHSWDYTSDGMYDNNWGDASLNTLLNDAYYNGDSITYYNNSSVGTVISFSLDGITKVTRDNNLISESIWYLGGYAAADGPYPSDMYEYERTNKVGTTINANNMFLVNANVGLAYVSDYGYSTNLEACGRNLNWYRSGTPCVTNNWLFFSNEHMWLMNPNVSYGDNVWARDFSGGVSTGYAFNTFAVHPVLYLNSKVAINGVGDGSSSNPYQLLVS